MSDQIEYAEIRLSDGDGNDYINFYVDGVTHSYLLEEVYELLNSKMPCGHLARYAANMENGTEYCVLCLIADRTNDVIHESIERDDLIATIKNAFELLEDDHIDAAQAILQMKFEKEQS